MATLDTLQDSVNSLTSSTTTLVTEVQTKKATLDASVANSVAARDASQSARDTALGYKSSAEAAAASATNTAASLVGFDLAAISDTIAATAVDVFVYDTSKDSDGGAWRKRTQGTSWYNEALNTATRGNRKEFPAVAVILLEVGKVTVYDADDPDLPMWGIWDDNGVESTVGGAWWYASVSVSRVKMLNGHLMFGENGGSSTRAGVVYINFIEDVVGRYGNATATHIEGKDASTGSKVGDLPDSVSPAVVVNSYVNDVAMTVLPNAPIDPATGLPVPTIAVATDGGVSVIKDDGTVVDHTNGASYDAAYQVDFLDDYSYVGKFNETSGASNAAVFVVENFTSSSPTFNLYNSRNVYNNSYGPSVTTNVGSTGGVPKNLPAIYTGKKEFAVAGNTFLAQVSEGNTLPSGMVAYAASTYNTGWMNGNIKGAFLSDTDATSVVGSGELVTNGTFATGTTGWTALSGAILTAVSGLLVVTNDGTGSNSGGATQQITTIVGKAYTLSIYSDQTAGSLRIGTSSGASNIFIRTFDSVGVYTKTFIATTTTTWITMNNNIVSAGAVRRYDNITCRLAEADRSVNNKGLQVFGTITKTAVATGADLVAYSGFSASNYLEQPHNSDLDFGTGDFSVMGWVNKTGNDGNQDYISNGDLTGSNGGWMLGDASGTLRIWKAATTSHGTTILTGGSTLPTATWVHFAAVKILGVTKIYLNGVEDGSVADTSNYTFTDAVVDIGYNADYSDYACDGSLALIRIAATAPSAAQIAKIYNDEKFLFQENAQATLYGASDAVTALAYDDATDLLHVGTSQGRSVFQGLRRVSNTAVAVGTAISASNGLVVEE